VYDKFPKSNPFVSFGPCLFFNWIGHLVVAGKVERATWARIANLNGNAVSTTSNMDSKPG